MATNKKEYQYSVNTGRTILLVLKHLMYSMLILFPSVYGLLGCKEEDKLTVALILSFFILLDFSWITLSIFHYLYDKDSKLYYNGQDNSFIFIHKDVEYNFKVSDIKYHKSYWHKANALKINILILKDGTQICMFEWLNVDHFVKKIISKSKLQLEDYDEFSTPFLRFHYETICAIIEHRDPHYSCSEQ